MRTIKYHIGIFLGLLCVFASCNEDTGIENPSGETFIYTLRITNGDITGAGRFDGVINEAEKAVTFTIPAESDIANVKFDGKLSLGAKMEFDSYDFSTSLTQPVRIINVDNQAEYTIRINLNAPIVIPFIDKMSILLENGREIDAFISMEEKTIYMKVPNENSVTLKNISSKPLRAEKVFTNLVNNKLNSDNPGKVMLDFMGLKSEFDISFGNIPVYGADFTKGTIFDFSLNPAGSTIYPDFVAENTRSTDFDGKHVLIVSREGGIKPKLFTLNDILSENVSSPISLNITNISGGTYSVSSGRLTQEHIYICNLTVGLKASEKLKIYHWTTPSSAPETVVDFDGMVNGNSISTGRFGDNMSVNLDVSGNGYIYLVEHVSGLQILRFTVTGFTNVSDPVVLTAPTAASYFASYNKVDGSTNEYLFTSTRAPLVLVDKDGVEIYKLDAAAIPIRGTDARIINFNSERYLIMTTGRAASGESAPTFYVYDLNAGFNTVSALSEFAAKDKTPLFVFSLYGESSAAYSASTGWGIVNDKLYTFAAAPRSGFTLFEFSKNE